MYEPGIEKLRRFSLTIALVILTFSLAGVSLAPNSLITVVGFSFQIMRPDFLPIGLIVASLYSIVRFYYYGFMLKKSPYRLRRDAIDSLVNPMPRISHGKRKKVSIYFGPVSDFEARISDEDRQKVEKYAEELCEIFPKFAGAKVSTEIVSGQYHDEDGEPVGIWYSAKVIIPVRCKLIAIIQDIDYSSPIWLNLVSLGVFFSQIG